MKVIKQQYLIDSTPRKVWKALTDPIKIAEWGAGPAKMTAEQGVKFSLWKGQVFGTNLEVIPNKKLVQEWWGGRWDEPTTVTFDLIEKDGKTQIKVVQENVPEEAHDELKNGWKKRYLGPLKTYLESK